MLIDRRTVVNVITRERRIPYVVNVNGPSLTARTWIEANGKSVPSELPLRVSDFKTGAAGLSDSEKIRQPGQVNSFGHWVKGLDNTYWASEETTRRAIVAYLPRGTVSHLVQEPDKTPRGKRGCGQEGVRCIVDVTCA